MNTSAMLRSLKELQKAQALAIDDPLGQVDDFLLDDQQWVLRYLVVDTGGLLTHRKLLVSRHLLGEPDLGSLRSSVQLKLTRKRFEDCPRLEEHAPVSRRYEEELARFYAYPAYWQDGMGLGAPAGLPPLQPPDTGDHLEAIQDIEACHLRSLKEITAYQVQASDGAMGRVEDFIAESDTWAMRYMVVNTGKWLPGKKVLISPAWIHEVDWHRGSVHATMTRDAIKGSPNFDPSRPINRDDEGRLYDYYGLPQYW